jgi:DNA-directed RNA polymerase specialized sigma24 family protein
MSTEENAASPDQDQQEKFELLRRAKAGDRDAAQKLFDKYACHVRRTIRRVLAPRARPLVDSEAVMQETRIVLVGKTLPPDVDSLDAFCSYISKVAYNKTLKENRDHLDCAKRSRHREVPLDDALQQGQKPSSQPLTPEEAEEAKVEFVKQIKDKRQRACRRVLEQVRAGRTLPDIAAWSGVPVRELERWLKWAEQDEARLAAQKHY